MLPALPNAPLCLILVLASVRHRCQINEDHFIWAIASKSKHKDNAIMEWINAETSKACGEMSNQLDKFSELAIFDPIEEAADTMADAYEAMSVPSDKPSPRRRSVSVSSDKLSRRRRSGAGGSASAHHRRRRSRSKSTSMSGFLRPTPRPSRIRLYVTPS